MTAEKMSPFVEQLRDALSWRQQAEWLSAVPEGVILRDHLKIRELLQRDGFQAGEDYLSALVAKINARRLKDGRHPPTILLALNVAHGLMMQAVREKGD